MTWHWIAFTYVIYLATTSVVRQDFAQIRARAIGGAAGIATLVTFDWWFAPIGRAGAVIVPSLVLLAGYRLSGLFFVRIDFPAEAWLMESDRRLLHRPGVLETYERMPRLVTEFLELSYLLVYPALPVGATVLMTSGHAADVQRYWTTVIAAAFFCYGALPWLKTRPPMLLEARASSRAPMPIRRLNQTIAAGASVRACTIPSGHAASALAAALTMTVAFPAAGAIFLVHAVTLAVASVLGRYHYALDAALGALVAVATFSVL